MNRYIVTIFMDCNKAQFLAWRPTQDICQFSRFPCSMKVWFPHRIVFVLSCCVNTEFENHLSRISFLHSNAFTSKPLLSCDIQTHKCFQISQLKRSKLKPAPRYFPTCFTNDCRNRTCGFTFPFAKLSSRTHDKSPKMTSLPCKMTITGLYRTISKMQAYNELTKHCSPI